MVMVRVQVGDASGMNRQPIPVKYHTFCPFGLPLRWPLTERGDLLILPPLGG